LALSELRRSEMLVEERIHQVNCGSVGAEHYNHRVNVLLIAIVNVEYDDAILNAQECDTTEDS
jgi:hypothetical protein